MMECVSNEFILPVKGGLHQTSWGVTRLPPPCALGLDWIRGELIQREEETTEHTTRRHLSGGTIRTSSDFEDVLFQEESAV